MAKAKTARFGEIVIEIENAPETDLEAGDWSKPCGVRTKGYNRTNNLDETEVPDCDDEDLPADVERDIRSRSAEITLAGALDKEDLDLWDEWEADGSTRRVRITVPGNLAAGGRTYVQPFKLASFNLGAERGQKWTFEATIQSDGARILTRAAA